jgi:hypothetical protein
MSAFILTDSQYVPVSVDFVDRAGNPAKVDGAPVWASSDEALFTVVAAADGLTSVVTATGKLGDGVLTVTADADLGAGITPVTLTQDLTFTSDVAVAGTAVTFGTPVEKP